jgi:hypothetical protein
MGGAGLYVDLPWSVDYHALKPFNLLISLLQALP